MPAYMLIMKTSQDNLATLNDNRANMETCMTISVLVVPTTRHEFSDFLIVELR